MKRFKNLSQVAFVLLGFSLLISATDIQEAQERDVASSTQQEILTIDSVGSITSQLTIVSDPRIETLLQIHREESLRRKGIDGYRLQIFSSSGDNMKVEAYQMKAKFLGLYPDIEAYVIFQAPEFKVRVGNFRDKSEALSTRARIQSDFPNPFITEDFISFPEIIIEDSLQVTAE